MDSKTIEIDERVCDNGGIIKIGTRLYNRGDMANVPHWGTIVRLTQKIHGCMVLIKIDTTDKTYSIFDTAISHVDKGNGLTRIVTEKANQEYRKKIGEDFADSIRTKATKKDTRTIDAEKLLTVKLHLDALCGLVRNEHVKKETTDKFNEVYDIVYNALNNTNYHTDPKGTKPKNFDAEFEVGEVYSVPSSCDHTIIFSFKVIKRTAKTVTIIDEGNKGFENKTFRRKIEIYNNCETIYPYGKYSMAPILRADK